MQHNDDFPIVSVIIPVFNRPDDLRRCLSSLVAQIFTQFEVLVCDDGSVEDTASVVDDFADSLSIQFLADLNFGGPARPRNRGISVARGLYVAFLDSDDWWGPEKLAQSVSALEDGADVVYHDLYVVRFADQTEFKEKILSTPVSRPVLHSLLCSGTSIPNSSAVVRKSCLDVMGKITESSDLISVEDYDTWIRLSRITERFVRLPFCLGYYWIGGGNISAPTLKQMDRVQKLYMQYLDCLPPFVRAQAEGFLAYRVGRIGMACGAYKESRSRLSSAMMAPISWAYRFKALAFLAKAIIKRDRA